jgi:UDPglucose 6-dehydrogenase
MDIETSELVKVAANSFLATKISFINAMAEIAEVTGADTVKLAEAIGYDERIGNKFLKTGVGFGGGCLPKDIRAFMARAEELGVQDAVDFLRDIDAINQRRRMRVIEILDHELGNIDGKTIGILGAAFKPESDDLRDSPALHVALQLQSRGATIQIHDPKAGEGVKSAYPNFNVKDDGLEVFHDADAIILATEWSEYKAINPEIALQKARNPLIIDGRNILDVELWLQAGWNLYALGRNVQRKQS